VQRFTIAHELGHRALHPGHELILDVPVRFNMRDGTSGTATDLEEIEANAYAAALLIPARMIREQISQLPRLGAANQTKQRPLSPGSSRSAPQR
jgi:Zn-dependent peptidase ImmA (M78 family)